MPWVRIEEKALTHPKIFGLSHAAFRLWVAGLAHCQQHLTDGFMPHAIVRTLIAVTPQRIHELVVAGLWERGESGFQVHDYLQHNDSRAKVLKARKQRQDRKQRWEDKQNREPERVPVRVPNASAPSGVVCSGDSQMSEEGEGGSGETKPPDRVRDFIEWYSDAHERYVGVCYLASSQKDYESACRLCERFTDQELRDAALVWFGQDDPFATSGTRTLTKFLSRASACVLDARKAAQRFSA